MFRPFATWAAVGVFGVLVLAGACAEPNLSEEDDGLGLPDREDVPDAPVPPTDGSAPVIDASVPDTAVADAADGAPPALRVFVSSTTSNANFGGLAGADTICKNLATGAALGGTWTAWLSNENGPAAITRVTSAGPWFLVTGEMVVTKAALITGTLAHAIDRDEKGATVAPSRVWTGTGANGRYLSNDCDKWTNGSEGRVGTSAGADVTWTSVGVDGCGQARRIYCFEL